MHKPRDFDAELKSLSDKAKLLRDRKLVQLGELAVATGADALPVEILAGALLAAAQSTDAVTTEGWRKSGAAFFQRSTRSVTHGDAGNAGDDAANNGGAKSAAADARSA